jgi:hypothetical protein
MRLGPVRIDILGGDEFRSGFDKGGLLRVQRAIRTVGADDEFVAIAEKGRRDAEMLELGASEIAEYRRRRRGLHRPRMMRAIPRIKFRSMAPGASLGADEGWRFFGPYGHATERQQHCHSGQRRPPQQAHTVPLGFAAAPG